ncbi:MAG: hypothetical protein HY046_01545 [Acidobacteria bacterium]|nr:hypothetical protein [Acidobacteriota bacterium]
MEKKIAQWTYWAGVASVVISVVWRGLDAVGAGGSGEIIRGVSLWYPSFLKGAFLFFMTAIASSCYAMAKDQKS